MGIADITRTVIIWIMSCHDDKNVIIVIPIYSNTENAEQLIRSTIAKADYFGKGKWRKIVCLDCGATKEAVDIIKKLSADYDSLEIQSKTNFGNIS